MEFLTTSAQVKQALKKVEPFAIRYSSWEGKTVVLTCTPFIEGRRPLWDVIFNGKQNRAPSTSKEVGKLAAGCLTSCF